MCAKKQTSAYRIDVGHKVVLYDCCYGCGYFHLAISYVTTKAIEEFYLLLRYTLVGDDDVYHVVENTLAHAGIYSQYIFDCIVENINEILLCQLLEELTRIYLHAR